MIYTTVRDLGRVSMTFEQIIRRGEETVATLLVKVASIDIRTKRPLRIDEELVKALQ